MVVVCAEGFVVHIEEIVEGCVGAEGYIDFSRYSWAAGRGEGEEGDSFVDRVVAADAVVVWGCDCGGDCGRVGVFVVDGC